MVRNLNYMYHVMCVNPSDINEHLPTIRDLASECDHITEMGVRSAVSAWAWLAGMPKDGLHLYDLKNPKYFINGDPIKWITETGAQHNIPVYFTEADVLEIDIEETDLLFIDTWHCYDQLKAELARHSDKAKKYICFHDTTSYAHRNEPLTSENNWQDKVTDGKGVWDAVSEFLDANKDTWELVHRYTNNNGFTIIKRI